MPKTIDRDLLDCLRRPNPYVEFRTEISAPDVGLVLRRPDQFIGVDSLMVGSMVPANSLATGPEGSLSLAGTSTAIASFIGESSSFDLNREDLQRRIKGVSWHVDPTFNRGVIRSVTVRVKRDPVWWLGGTGLDFELQVYRVTRTPGVIGNTPVIHYSHEPLLSPAALIKSTSISWSGSPEKATLTFDLSNYRLIVDNGPPDSVSADQTSELPYYYFVVRPINPPQTTGVYSWMIDTTTSRTVAGVGSFQRSFWNRESDQEEWQEQLFNDCPYFVLSLDSFPASGQAVYKIDLGRTPAAGTLGRVVAEKRVPRGCTAQIEISLGGSSGPWTAVANGDAISAAQQLYHLRVTLYPDSAVRAAPTILALGVEFRTQYDVSLESILEFPTREIEMPWGKASIPEARVGVLRTGTRDYLDLATLIGSTKGTPQLEADIFLASRHPSVTRDKWLRLERMSITNRLPGPTGELFTLLSFASKLKRKIPQKSETLNTVHTVLSSVTSAGTTSVTVSPVLVGTTNAGHEYDGKHYYARIRSSSVDAIPPNFQQEIAGSDGNTILRFTPQLPGNLASGDQIEVHSGVFVAQPIVWKDEDPAQVWQDVLTSLGGISSERVGHGSLPRGGYPPTVSDRAPGDLTTQNKLTVTISISEEVALYELLDQLSALMGGATIEIDGQICFVQIYPLRAADGTVTIPLPAVSAVFDVRDIAAGSLSTPPGLEARATVISAGYGKNLAATDPDEFPEKATVVVDNDALSWLTKQDLEEVGSSELPEDISRWCYNTSDEGLLLATQAAEERVRAISTGLRVFPFQSIDLRPELVPGDAVGIITDQYTDYDPSTDTELRGPLAIRGVLVAVGGAGRSFRVFIPGLAESARRLSGGNADPYPYFLGPDRPEALFGLKLEVVSETTTERTYRVTRGAFVDQVWLGVMEFDSPLPSSPWASVAAVSEPLPSGQDTFTVTRPTGKRVTLIQVEPRASDLTLTGNPWQATLEAAPPQLPAIEVAYSESGRAGTGFAALRKRGESLVTVQVQTKSGGGSLTPWTTPLRSAGAYSYVKQRPLVTDEYEHDVLKDQDRPSTMQFRGIVEGSGEVITTDPMVFDWNTVPDILFADADGSVVTVICDSDAKSVRLQNTAGTWEFWVDGPSVKVNLQTRTGNGSTGSQSPMGAGQVWPILITAYSEIRAEVTSATAHDTASVVAKGSTTTTPTWEYVNVAAPVMGSVSVPIVLDSDTTTGLGTKISARYNDGSGFTALTDITASLSPALGAPPLASTTYIWAGLPAKYVRTESTNAVQIELEIVAEMLDAGAPVARETRRAIWYYGASGGPEEPPQPPEPPPNPEPYVSDPKWDAVTIAAPPVGSKTMTITLDANIAPGTLDYGTVELLMRRDDGSGYTPARNIASEVTPAVSVPPETSTDYTWVVPNSGGIDPIDYTRQASGTPVIIEITANIKKSGLVVATLKRSVSWLYTDPRI